MLALATGLMWYLQFFLYGLGHVRMGKFKFAGWVIHWVILILLSCGFGVAMGAWRAGRPATNLLLLAAFALLRGAASFFRHGDFLAAPSAG
jgi:L-rhamnose-H+ transport protein